MSEENVPKIQPREHSPSLGSCDNPPKAHASELILEPFELQQFRIALREAWKGVGYGVTLKFDYDPSHIVYSLQNRLLESARAVAYSALRRSQDHFESCMVLFEEALNMLRGSKKGEELEKMLSEVARDVLSVASSSSSTSPTNLRIPNKLLAYLPGYVPEQAVKEIRDSIK